MARRAVLAVMLTAACAGAQADPGYYVVTAYDQAGINTAELRYWTTNPDSGAEQVWPEIAIARGINSRWTTRLLASFIGPSNLRVRQSTLSWQNDVLLTQGELPFDLALHTDLIRPAERSDGHTLEFGPALQTDVGRTQLNANIFFERRFGADQPRPTRLKYQWQVRHRWHPALHLGLQGFGELGTWAHWAPHHKQSHRAGPALFSTLPLQGDNVLKVEGALLLGSTYAKHGHMFSMRVACDF